MTSKVRIEKADNYPVSIMVQEQNVDAKGQWVNTGAPVPLQHAAQLFEGYVHQNKRYVVGELQLGDA